ncbi:hypothetical protein N7472_007585 [Penicillium cf. griseofulvum]|uniref:Uncharacterized protein n=1 Tax=Penicillium cf. griseofulvum TaxID=2972120 RepID=A0A9W9J3L1_9EURO|nr:hypothetical protein N7472_007585 [Penicillium cf. griseofulvum]
MMRLTGSLRRNLSSSVVTPPGEHCLSDALVFLVTGHAIVAARNRYAKWPADFNSDKDIYPDRWPIARIVSRTSTPSTIPASAPRVEVSPESTRRPDMNRCLAVGPLQQFQHVGIEEENDNDEPIGLAAMDLGVEDDGVDKHANQLATIPLPSNATEAGGCTQREREREMRERSGRWKVEVALHNNHYMLISYVWGQMGLDLWVYGVQEWADSTLYN